MSARETDSTDSKANKASERSTPPDGNKKQNPPDFKAYFKKLQDASEVGFDELCNRANQLRPEIPPLTMRKKGNFVLHIDEKAQRVIPTGKLSGEYIAIRTYGDGNSLFRAASVLAFGDESKHPEMRVRTAVELACNKSYYITFPYRKERLRAQEQFMQRKSSRYGRDKWSGELKKSHLEVIFDKDVRGTCKESPWVSDFHLQVLPTVFQRSVKIVSKEGSGMYLSDVIHPRHGYSKLEPLVIMWISFEPSEEMLLSHFVPLVPVGEVCSFGKDLGKQYEDSLAQSQSQPTREQIKPTTSFQETTV